MNFCYSALELGRVQRARTEMVNQSKVERQVAIGCGACVVLFFGVILISELFRSSTPYQLNSDKIGALVASEQAVRNLLKAPSTAKFPSTSEASITYDSDGGFVISSYVDAQDSFGAMIRTRYVCRIKEITRDNYSTNCDLKE